MTCDEFQTQLTSYLDGTLNADECAALESHAATCAACELRLERATAGALPVFAPPLPTELRAPVLQAVVDRKRQSRSTFLARVSAVVGIAALLAFMLRPTLKQAQLVVADSSSVTAANLAPGGERSPADERAQSEFIALDDAARELQSAIARSPGDGQLSAFLQSVTARRAELRQRVRDARS